MTFVAPNDWPGSFPTWHTAGCSSELCLRIRHDTRGDGEGEGDGVGGWY